MKQWILHSRSSFSRIIKSRPDTPGFLIHSKEHSAFPIPQTALVYAEVCARRNCDAAWLHRSRRGLECFSGIDLIFLIVLRGTSFQDRTSSPGPQFFTFGGTHQCIPQASGGPSPATCAFVWLVKEDRLHFSFHPSLRRPVALSLRRSCGSCEFTRHACPRGVLTLHLP